jgi:2-keto-4-pentenoate hydratase/2-oxohepta-3-ene-1,7-dioic acid hydratase in catechol pathway
MSQSSSDSVARTDVDPSVRDMQFDVPAATRWIRFWHAGSSGFGMLDGGRIRVFAGDMFAQPEPTGALLALADVRVLRPCSPSKVIAMYNNFAPLVDKLGQRPPGEPQYLLKPPNTYLDPGASIEVPACDSRVIFEGELGIVIGRTCKNVAVDQALAFVFGYTCANDVTAADVLTRDPSFAHWARAKGFDGFCPFGPVISTGLDPSTLVVRTLLNGQVRQNFPASDMLFSVPQLVSRISRDMTLVPGDLILSGTSVGVGVMKPGSSIEVEITGIGTLSNRFGI